MIGGRLFLVFGLFAGIVSAQQYVISTVAGGAPPATPAAATSVPLSQISGVAADNAGDLYFTSNNCVFKVNPYGVLTLFAGNSRPGYSGDGGPATMAQLNEPSGVAVDGAGNAYIADTTNFRIRRVSATGVIATVAGNGYSGPVADGGPATNAALGIVFDVALDGAGNLYISDALNNVVRRVSAGGIITTVAGNGTFGYTGDGGPAASAELSAPHGLALDSSGNLFIAENYRVRKVSPGGTITTVAGNAIPGYSGDGGPAANAQLDFPEGLAFDSLGDLIVADTGNNRVRSVSANGTITTIAGNGTYGFTGDGGLATLAQVAAPLAAAVDSSGNVVVSSAAMGPSAENPLTGAVAVADQVLRKVSPAGIITTMAGTATQGLTVSGGPGVAVDSSGNLYVTGYNNVLKVAVNGTVTSVAGTGVAGFSGDGGPAASAQLGSVAGLAVDGLGNLLIADSGNNRVRKVAANGIITTVAGNGASAELLNPEGVAVDRSGNIFIADSSNNRIRMVSPDGIVTTVAGTGVSGFSGDGGPAISAQLANPVGVAVDSSGDIFIADEGNRAIRKISSGGTITTVFGNGPPGGICAFSCAIGPTPTAVAADSSGNVYITAFAAVFEVLPNGFNYVLAGGASGYSGDGGLGTSAELEVPNGIAVDAAGDVFVSDSGSHAIRKLTPTGQTVVISAVMSAASEQAASVSPGEIVVIYGGGMGPVIGVSATPVNGAFGTTLAGTTVTVNGVAAPVFYASETQVNAIIPYGISGATANVTVSYQSGVSAAFSVPVAASAPGLFSYNASGAGQAAAVNFVDGTVNTAANPVKIGGYIELYATGEGQTSPAGVDGKLAGLPLPAPNLPVSVTVGGVNALVQYYGAAYGEVAGLMQVNVQIPAGVTPGGYVPVVLTVGNTSTVSGALWIAVSN